MTRPLPARASLEHLRNEAKAILRAHDERNPDVCPTLRNLRQFAGLGNNAILQATIPLQQVQHALAIDYGFSNWAGMRKHMETRDHEMAEERRRWEDATPGQVRPQALIRYALRELDLPDDVPYLGAGVPAAITQILRHAGEDVEYSDVAAACGWAFSFSYLYTDFHVAALSVDQFAFLAEQLGYERTRVPCSDRDAMWTLVTDVVDQERPLVCTMLDGGLVYGYREQDDKREMWFDGRPILGWTDIEEPHPMDTCDAFTKAKPARAEDEIARDALRRAVLAGTDRGGRTAPHGVNALEAYLRDVGDETKDFAGAEFWFCWAGFERLSSRWCCAQWLRKVAVALPDFADRLTKAASKYEKAFRLYEKYRVAAHTGVPTDLSLQERARTPERIAIIAPILRQAIDTERAGLDTLADVVSLLD